MTEHFVLRREVRDRWGNATRFIERVGYGSSWTSRQEAEAHLAAEELPTEFGSDYYPNQRYFVDVMTWQEREAQRFLDDADYAYPCWVNEAFWLNGGAVHEHHYAHVSLKDPGLIAFTMSPEHGAADRQTRMKPGKYLTKYFADVLTFKQIAFYAEWFMSGTRPQVPLDVTLEFATTEDEIAQVYYDGPSSCMDRRHFQPDKTPVRVYAAGDLAVAYLRDNASAKVIARALCWPEKKALGRVYPTPDNWQADGFTAYEDSRNAHDYLLHTLKKQGYTHVHEQCDVLNGARILKRKTAYGRDYVMPYIDNDYGVSDGGEFWIMDCDDYAYSCSNTDGTLRDTGDDYDEDDDRFYCDNCEDHYYEGDSSANTVWTTPAGGVQTWCQDCVDNNSFYCDGTGRTYDEGVDHVNTDRGTFAMNWFDRNGGYCCDRTGEHFLERYDPPVSMENGEVWSPDAFRDEGFACTYDGTRWPKEEVSILWAGFPAACDDDAIPLAERLTHHPVLPTYADPVLAVHHHWSRQGPVRLGLTTDQWLGSGITWCISLYTTHGRTDLGWRPTADVIDISKNWIAVNAAITASGPILAADYAALCSADCA